MRDAIARGVVRLTNESASEIRFLGVEIQPEAIYFRNLEGKSKRKTLFEAAGSLGSDLQAVGSLVSSAWPVAPREEFVISEIRVAQLTAEAEDFSIRVTNLKPFGVTPDTHFSDLDVTLRHVTGAKVSAEPGSQAVLHLFGTSLALAAAIDETRGLTFVAGQAEAVAIDDIGTLHAGGIVASVDEDGYGRWQGMVASYLFAEREGPNAHDDSGDLSSSEEPVTLVARSTAVSSDGEPDKDPAPALPQWRQSAIKLDGTYYLAPRVNASKVIVPIRESEAFSIETWIKPESVAEQGRAQILAFRVRGTSWFSLAQGSTDNAHGDHLSVDIRLDGQSGSLFFSPAGSLPKALTHVVYTRGADGHERIFVNTELVAERDHPGSLSQWADDIDLIIGSDEGGNSSTAPSWHGKMFHLAVYKRALSAEEVFRHYLPAFTIEGSSFVPGRVPAPLAGVAIPATMQVGKTATTIAAEGSVDLAIRPNLRFKSVRADLSKTGDAAWTLAGVFETQIWQGVVELEATLEAETRLLRLSHPVDQVESLEIPGLGPIAFAGIELSVTDAGDELEWDLSSQRYVIFTPIPALLPWQAAADSEFHLRWPTLGLDETDVALRGQWLGIELALHTRPDEADAWSFKGDLTFSMVFSLDLPALFNEETGARLTEAIRISDEQMHFAISVELTDAGFLATQQAHFSYTDASGQRQSIVLPERRWYTAPKSRNQILGDVLDRVERSAASLIEDQGRNIADYYLTLGDEQPRIIFSTTGSEEPAIATRLPRLFAADTRITSANEVFTLDQSGESSRLLIARAENSAALRSEYDDLMTQVAAAAPTSAGAVRVLSRRIAERVPADYDALLYYYYGWDPDLGHIDLQGGMRLRVDVQSYQLVPASDPSAKRGFVGSGSFHLAVRSYTYPQSDGSHAQLLGFGPFVSQLRANGSTDITFQGAGGIFDLVKDGNRKAFYRMFYPKQPSTGLGPERVVTILGTDTLADLQAATADFDPDGESLPTRGTTFFFRGKAFITPEIQVFVGNEPTYVPVGTTLRQLIESTDDLPAAAQSPSGQDLSAFAGRSRPLRRVHEGANSKPEYRFINLTTGTAVGGMDVLDLPLVKGDRFDR